MVILKIGGGKGINIGAIAERLNEIEGEKIIVHGANAFRDDYALKLNIEKKVITSVKGYSSVYSDKNLIDLQMMIYAGLRNKRIVELLQKNHVNAIGLTGLDGQLIKGKRNRGMRIKENGKIKIVRDYSGKPLEINKPLLQSLIQNGLTPVITVPIIDENGFAINSENDDIVALLNEVLKPDKIIQFIEAPGLLKDAEDEQSVVPELSKSELTLWEERLGGRIKRKIHALNKLFVNNNPELIIVDGRVENPIYNVLNKIGTIVK